MLILYLPTITYIICISVRFYGIKKWINKIIDEPVYFIFPILTSFSFYEKSKLNFQENFEKLDQLSVPQNVSQFNSQSMDAETKEKITVGSKRNITSVTVETEKLKRNEQLSVPQKVYPSMDSTEKDGNMKNIDDVWIEIIEDTLETTVDTTRNITSMSADMENKNEQLSIPQNNSPNYFQSRDSTEKDGNMKTIDDVWIETIEDTFETTEETTNTYNRNNTSTFLEMEKKKEQLSVPQNNSPENHFNIKTIDDDGIETIEDNFETTIETKDKITPKNKRNNAFMSVEKEKQFSIRQSNTLFFLFCASTSLCIFGDLWHQWMRGKRYD